MAQIIKRGVDTWQIRVFLGKNESGKKLFHTKTIHGLKRDALAYANEFSTKLKAGYAGGKIVTLKELWSSYLAVKKNSISPNTLYLYELYWRKVWQPLEKMVIDDITPMVLQRFLDINGAKNPSWYKQALTPLRACLSQAVKWGLIPSSPCSSLLLPKITRKEREILSPEEIQRFLEACKSAKHGLWFRLVLTTGIRTGEALALCWDCVNFENQSIFIKRDLITKLNTIREGTKNQTSRRIVKLDDITYKALLNAYSSRINNLVFPGSIPEKPLTRMVLYLEFSRLLKAANITKKLRLYDLRHSCASFLINSGIPVRTVSDRLGHCNPYQTLKTYTHSLPEQEAQAIALFANL